MTCCPICEAAAKVCLDLAYALEKCLGDVEQSHILVARSLGDLILAGCTHSTLTALVAEVRKRHAPAVGEPSDHCDYCSERGCDAIRLADAIEGKS